MPPCRRIVQTTLTACLAIAATCAPAADGSLTFFESQIRPLLAGRCYQCHSARNGKMKSGLALDHRDGLLRGGDSGPVIVPGLPARSLLIKAVRRTDAKLQMPPEGDALSASEIADLEKWITSGAPDPRDNPAGQPAHEARINWDQAREHWAFRPLKKPALPPGNHLNPVDAFIFDRMLAAEVAPAPPADRATWIRRVTFSLTGLPPSVPELEQFRNDPDPDHAAKQAVIERLLASEHYGVHWARHWLDVVRFGETSGAPSQYPIADAWKYRDYVVDAFNRDKAYPQFIREQIAGDLLPFDSPAARREQLIATGFLALARRFENTAIMKHLVIEDVLDTTGQALLGLSLSCARCHDHKFDPIPAADYYALYGIFESTAFPFPGKEHLKAPAGLTVLGADERSRDIARLYDQLDGYVRDYDRGYHLRGAIRDEYDGLRSTEGRTPEQEARFQELEKISDQARELTSDKKNLIEALRKKFPDESAVDSVYAVRELPPTNARIQRRGEVYNRGDEVPRGFLTLFENTKLPADTPSSGRRELADWLTSAASPLSLRVVVNRVWHWHFGRGLVTTPNDFGTRGNSPTHPELLEFLTAWFIENGASIKKLHHLILTSRTYGLAGDHDEAARLDPANLLYARFDRRRLTAEELRDSLLFVAGRLDPQLGGGHGEFIRPVKSRTYSQGGPFRPSYPETDRRRSLYLFQHRSKPHPFLAIFDGADTTVSTPVRGASTTALQGLFFLNAPLFHECADQVAARLMTATEASDQRLDLASNLIFSRPPTTAERALVDQVLKSAADEKAGWQSVARILLAANPALFVE